MYFVSDTTRRGSLTVPLELITWKHTSREQIIFSVELKYFFHKEAAELFIILLYCLFSLKNENELIFSHPPPHSTPSLKDE